MKPRLAFVLLAASVAMGYGVYKVKYEVRALKVEARALEAEIARESETIEVLEAEWAYLTRPTRLEELAQRHLKLGAVQPAQVATMKEFDDAMSQTAAADAPSERRLASVRSMGR